MALYNYDTQVSLFINFIGLGSTKELDRFSTVNHEELILEAKEYSFEDEIQNINGTVKGVVCAFTPENTTAPHTSITNLDNNLWQMSITQNNKIVDILNKRYNHDPCTLPDTSMYISKYCATNLLDHQPSGHKTFENVTVKVASKVKGITTLILITNYILKSTDGLFVELRVRDDVESEAKYAYSSPY